MKILLIAFGLCILLVWWNVFTAPLVDDNERVIGLSAKDRFIAKLKSKFCKKH